VDVGDSGVVSLPQVAYRDVAGYYETAAYKTIGAVQLHVTPVN